MALYNQNYKAINLTPGTYTTGDLGNGVTGTCIHQLFCLSPGEINITAFGGGNFTWSASTSEVLDIVVGACVVASGEFVGFKSKLQNNYSQKVFYP